MPAVRVAGAASFSTSPRPRLVTAVAARVLRVRTPLCTVRSTAPVFFLEAVRLRAEPSEGDTDTPKPPKPSEDEGFFGQYPSLSLGPYLQGFLRLAEVAFEAARGFPRADAERLELVELVAVECPLDRPELERRGLDFPAVRFPEVVAPDRVAPPFGRELLRREVERLEVLEAPPLGFFFWP